MFKNVASQKLIVFAFDATTNLPKSGDAANITAYVGKDFGAATVLGDTSATEIDATNAKGYYLFDLTATETNADTLHFTAKSSTANVVVLGVPATAYTLPANFTTASIDSNGRVDVIKIAGTTQTARDIGASVLLSAGSGTGQLDFTSGVVKGNVTQIDGSVTTGNNATLNLKSLNINAAGTGLNGLTVTGGTNVAGVVFAGAGSGAAFQLAPGATGIGFDARGGATSGVAISLTTFAGDAISVAPVAGHGINVAANGTSKHGVLLTGGTAGTSDGFKAVAGTGGVPIRGDITGNVTGNVSGSVGSLTTNNDKTGYSLTQTFPSNFSALSITAGGLVDITQTAADKVWSTTTRQLTGTQTFNVTGNITGNLSGSVGSVTGAVGSVGSGGITAATFAAGAIDASAVATDAITSAELATSAVSKIASGVWTYVIENSKTAEQFMRIIKASAAGKLSGAATTTVTVRDDADAKARITATVDSSGNRSAVTLDGT